MELLKENADNCGADIQMVPMTQIQQRSPVTWWSLSNIEEHRLLIVGHQESQSICSKMSEKKDSKDFSSNWIAAHFNILLKRKFGCFCWEWADVRNYIYKALTLNIGNT